MISMNWLKSLGGKRIGQLALAGLVAVVVLWWAAGSSSANPEYWKRDWPKTDFSKASVPFGEILSGGPPKDGIPAVDHPIFVPVTEIAAGSIADTEPVIAVSLNGDTRAYPLRILMWHEIVNDTVGGVPVSVTFCPLCNSALVFDRRLDGMVLDFGTTGKLRHSDMVMYDRQTESWWQQFLGEAIIGELTGKRLKMLPVRVESFANFRARGNDSKVLVPTRPGMRRYGANPYRGYDSQRAPIRGFYLGTMPDNIAPLARVVVIEDEAWALSLLRKKKKITKGDVVIRWEPGQNSALDAGIIAEGRDIGNVTVQRKTANGLEDIVHDISFAFAFHAFKPKGTIHVE
jgi:hypothetical protein